MGTLILSETPGYMAEGKKNLVPQKIAKIQHKEM